MVEEFRWWCEVVPGHASSWTLVLVSNVISMQRYVTVATQRTVWKMVEDPNKWWWYYLIIPTVTTAVTQLRMNEWNQKHEIESAYRSILWNILSVWFIVYCAENTEKVKLGLWHKHKCKPVRYMCSFRIVGLRLSIRFTECMNRFQGLFLSGFWTTDRATVFWSLCHWYLRRKKHFFTVHWTVFTLQALL